MKVTATINATLYAASTGITTVGQLLAGAQVEQVQTVNNRYGFYFGVGDAPVKQTLVWANVSAFATPPAPSVIKFGLHLLGEAQNGDGKDMPAGVYPASLGCQSYLVFGGVVGAWDLQQRTGATVLYRPSREVPTGAMPDPARVIDECRYMIERGGAVTTGVNECDQQPGGCGSDPNKIAQRANYERDFLARAKAINPNCTVVAGGWSYGTPDFTRADVCDAIRTHYAPNYNSGAWKINVHLYSPDLAHIDNPAEWKWYERRWEWLFTHCGFDPARRGSDHAGDGTGRHLW